MVQAPQQAIDLEDCLRNGTQMGWLIDPDDRGIFIYQPGQEVQVLDRPDEVLPMPTLMDDFTYRVADLFGLLVL